MLLDRDSIWHRLWQMIRYNQSLYWTDTVLWLLIAGLPALPGLVIREFFSPLTAPSIDTQLGSGSSGLSAG